MTDKEIASEVVRRAVKLFEVKCDPLRILTSDESGRREFVFGNWWFRLTFHVPRHWSFSGPRFGQLRNLGVYVNGTYNNPPFWLDTEDRPDSGEKRPLWQIDREVCVNELIPSLRLSMILDDLAEIPE